MTEHLAEVRYSVDGGHNWSSWRITDMGDTGAFVKRVVFRRFGSAREFVFQVRVSGPIAAHLLCAEAMVRQGVT